MGIFNKKKEAFTVPPVSEPLMVAGEPVVKPVVEVPTPVEEVIVEEPVIEEIVEEPVVEEIKEEPQEEELNFTSTEEEETEEEQTSIPTAAEFVEKLNAVISNLDSRITNLEAAVFRAMSTKQ